MISIVLVVTGGLVWFFIGLSVLSTLLSRGPLARFLRRPALYPYTIWSDFRFKGVLLSRSRKLSSEVKTALRSASLRDAKRLRDALVEIDALPTIAKGKQGLGLGSIFELSNRSVRHKKTPFTHPLQNPPYFLPGVPSKAFHDPRDYEWAAPLEAAFPMIRKELLSVLAADGEGFKAYKDEYDQRLAGWNTFNFFFFGEKVEENCARCPETTRLLESLPRFERDHVMFSALNPHTHIPAHYGPMNGILRAHLPLVAPPGCYIRVGEEERTWEQGKLLVFDDSYYHEVWNHSDRLRVVLFMNFWDPCFAPAEIPVLERFRRAYERTPYSKVHEANQKAPRAHDLVLAEKHAA